MRRPRATTAPGPAVPRTALRLRRRALPLPPDLDGRALLRWIVACQGRPVALGTLAGIVWMAAMALYPALVGEAVDRGVASGEVAAALPWAAALLGLGGVRVVAGAVRHWLAVRLYADTRRVLAERIVQRAVDPRGGLDRVMGPGEVVSHADSDTERIGAAVDVLCRGAGAVVSLVVVVVALLSVSGSLGLVVLLGAPPLTIGVMPLLRPFERRSAVQQERLAAASATAADAVAGLRVLKGFGGEPAMRDRFFARASAVRHAAVGLARLDAGWTALRVAVPGLFLALIVWLGSQQVLAGTLSPGGLVAAFGYATFLITPLATFVEVARKWARARASADRIARLLATPPEAPAPTAPRPVPDGPGTLVLDEVTVPDEDGRVVLDRCRLAVPAGTSVGVVVDDDATRDALLALLQGRRSATAGAVLVDGVDLARVALERRRATVLVAEHEARLLAGTLRDNLLVDADDATLLGALADVAAADVVDRLGLDGTVTGRGRSLSGGQRQRVALARALLADPTVLVLDDPTTAVDAHTERLIAGGLVRRRAGRTTVVLSRSPVLLGATDRLVLVEGGRVVADGPPRELLADERVRRCTAGAEWAVST